MIEYSTRPHMIPKIFCNIMYYYISILTDSTNQQTRRAITVDREYVTSAETWKTVWLALVWSAQYPLPYDDLNPGNASVSSLIMNRVLRAASDCIAYPAELELSTAWIF